MPVADTPRRTLRVADDEWSGWVKAAKKEGLSVSAWIRAAATDRLAATKPKPKGKLIKLKGITLEGAGAPLCPPHPKAARTVLNGGLVRCGACGDLVK